MVLLLLSRQQLKCTVGAAVITLIIIYLHGEYSKLVVLHAGCGPVIVCLLLWQWNVTSTPPTTHPLEYATSYRSIACLWHRYALTYVWVYIWTTLAWLVEFEWNEQISDFCLQVKSMESFAGPSMYDRVAHNKNVEVTECPFTKTGALECMCAATCCMIEHVCYIKWQGCYVLCYCMQHTHTL